MEIIFHDREKEIEEIMRILSSRPDLITFVYGPINSGKTELFQYLIDRLPDEFVVFYVNLRGRFIKEYEDFVRVLFKFKKVGKEEILKEVLMETIKSFKGIPVPETLLDVITRKDAKEDVFEFLEDYLSNIAKRKTPILILDELQVIGDLKIDDLLIYKLFNFFIRLTKELHCCHVFAITSDSLFIEKVYAEAMLHGRCDYILVDDFDYKTTAEFLRKYGFSEEEIELAWEYLGGKPVYLVGAIKNKDRLKEFCKELFEDRVSMILYGIKDLKRKNEGMFKQVLNIFEQFEEYETIECDEISDEVVWCVKNNVLFLDPRKRLLKPQSRIDLLAIRKILKEVLQWK